MTITDQPTLSVLAARTTGALALARRNLAIQSSTLHSALHNLFMETMAYYCAASDKSMSQPMVQTLHVAASALQTGRAQWLVLNLTAAIVERSCAYSDPAVYAALTVAYKVLAEV